MKKEKHPGGLENMNKTSIEKRLSDLEDSPAKREKTAEQMTDAELCQIIGIENPTDEQLIKISEGKL